MVARTALHCAERRHQEAPSNRDDSSTTASIHDHNFEVLMLLFQLPDSCLSVVAVDAGEDGQSNKLSALVFRDLSFNHTAMFRAPPKEATDLAIRFECRT
ncbi:hypothetical protein BHE74_00027850 [Ensete ventricosum]|nr:hypothetical protein BHE74_00027850 [Ensete ventricosum]